MPTPLRPIAPRPQGTSGLTGARLRDLLDAGITGLESVPAVRPGGRDARTPHLAAGAAAPPSIERFLYRGPAALAAARALVERLVHAPQPPAAAEVEELHDLLRLAASE